MEARIADVGDLWSDLEGNGQGLTGAIERLREL
jgi:hypothetical protein